MTRTSNCEPPAVRAENLCKRYGSRRVLDGASFEARGGQLVAIVGENGGGKTTLLRILAGVEPTNAGSVHRNGELGYCPQECILYPFLTPDEHFELFGCAYGLDRTTIRARRDSLAERFGFEQHRRRVVQELSGGTRQKVNLAIALLHDPAVLLLDEPYAGLDVETYRRVIDWLGHARQQKKCVIVVTHILFEREQFDTVLNLQAGVLHAVLD